MLLGKRVGQRLANPGVGPMVVKGTQQGLLRVLGFLLFFGGGPLFAGPLIEIERGSRVATEMKEVQWNCDINCHVLCYFLRALMLVV